MSKHFEEKIIRAVVSANTVLRSDVSVLLARAAHTEKNKKAKQALEIILENAVIAWKKKRAICQDTGLPLVFLEAGRDIDLNKKLLEKIFRAVRKGYADSGFRASTIDCRGRMGFSPDLFHVEFTEKKGLKITIFPKGFGSENKSQLKMFNPTASEEEVDAFIVNAVKAAGPAACPPFFVGVGIGGTSDTSLVLAKQALLENMTAPGKDKKAAAREKRLLRKINALKIGPMGLGGRNTCLAVKIRRHATHIAGMPVGVNISCHALRGAAVKFSRNELNNIKG